MPETETLTLPLLPLTPGVILPQMVVTLAIESPEARDAAEGALATDRRGLLVPRAGRSEEHTSELQSHHKLVCRLLLEKKNHKIEKIRHSCRRAVLRKSSCGWHTHAPPHTHDTILPHPSSHATHSSLLFFFFFNDTATTEIYTLSLHDALPI